MALPQEFWELFGNALEGATGADGSFPAGALVQSCYEDALDKESPACVRLNPWKQATLPILEGAERIPWSEEGWRLVKRPVFTLHPLFHAGVYYVQDASSMFVGAVLRRLLQMPEIRAMASSHPLRVLDLCAAPGGKTTDAAASLRKAFGDNFSLTANEVVPRRAAILRDNVEIWGDPNVAVTSLQPARAAALGPFNIILVDAPCSGEGMFRKEPQALEQWSRRKVEECAALQRKILSDIAPALAPGGYLIYSTCTYNTLENEGSVASLLENPGFEALDLRSLMAAETAKAAEAGESLLWSKLPVSSGSGAGSEATAVRLIPGLVHGEGQFCALLRSSAALGADGEARADGSRAGSEIFQSPEKGRLKIGHYSLPQRPGTGASASENTGAKGAPDRPANDKACSTSYVLDRTACPNVAVDKQTALNYLHGDSLVLPGAPMGQLLLTYKDIPLGYVKNVGNRCNNLYPKSRRIKIDVTL